MKISSLILSFCLFAQSLSGQTFQFGSTFTNGATISTCSGVFYDSGGLAGNYAANESYTVTFKSATTDPIRITFLSFNIESSNLCSADKLQIYNGPNTSSPLLGTFCGTNTPSSITGAGTSLTIRFISNGTTQSSGWAALIACADCATADCDEFVNLDFHDPITVADPAGLIGDKWRFANIMAGFDGLIEITNAVNANAILTVDDVSGPAGSWSPYIDFNFVNGQDSYIDVKMTMVAAGTSTPTNLPLSSRLTSWDVDGGGAGTYRELQGHINPNGYILNVPTELTIATEGVYTMVAGSFITHPGFTTDPEVKITFYYPGQNNTFFLRIGVRTVNFTGSNPRQFAVSFDPCTTYPTANVIPIVPNIIGSSNACDEPTYQYTSPALFSSYTWTANGGAIISGQGTKTVNVNWNTLGNRSIRLRTVDANGCIANTTRSIEVYPNPILAVSNTGPYCVGATIQLNSTASGTTAPYSYLWNGPLTYSANISSPTRTNAIITHSGAYNVTATDANSCVSTSNTTVSVSAFPIVTITTTVPNTVCTGQSATLNANYSGGAGICTYQWQSKTGSGAWVDIAGATSNTYNVAALTNTIIYRAKVTCTGGGCCN